MTTTYYKPWELIHWRRENDNIMLQARRENLVDHSVIYIMLHRIVYNLQVSMQYLVAGGVDILREPAGKSQDRIRENRGRKLEKQIGPIARTLSPTWLEEHWNSSQL